MSVRVVARLRPLLAQELEKDIIVRTDSVEPDKPPTIVKIPNPRNEAEEFSFTFNGVYGSETTQETLFTAEVAPHIKSLFQGLDVTIFAYGVTGMKLAERGVIPRLLSGIFRRGKKIMKETNGETTVDVALSYYEIYNDKVYDLMEPPEKRTPTGLPLRAEANGKTVVVGLTERACEDLKDFEKLYIEANNNRVTAATKLNAHSSRSHAILRVKLTQTTGNMVRESTASAIDLAGSEDNRRTDNGKERMVESAAINKSLFVLSQCIDAISTGAKRIPYRESKMTRILSLGQNNGITVMILNLSPLRNYHLDTLSSLNVSSRAKRIEVREIENEVVFKQVPRTNSAQATSRQPLKPLANAVNTHIAASANAAAKATDAAKPVKAFSVYTDKAKASAIARPSIGAGQPRSSSQTRRSSLKRSSDHHESASRPSKLARPILHQQTSQPQVTHPSPPSDATKTYRTSLPQATQLSQPSQSPQQSESTKSSRTSLISTASQPITVTAAEIEALVERKVSEILAAREAAEESVRRTQSSPEASDAVQRRLEALERRIENEEWREDAKSEGLRHLLAARHHKERGDSFAALKAYEMALPYFPNQPKLLGKIERLKARLEASGGTSPERKERKRERKPRRKTVSDVDADDAEADGEEECETTTPKIKATKLKARRAPKTILAEEEDDDDNTPRTQRLLDVVNSRDATQIRELVGFGVKKAQDLVNYLEHANSEGGGEIEKLSQLRTIPGMGGRTVDRAYEGLAARA
ncbi:kinesin-like protein [Trichoderma citrinoviride]|uniref:Kinesin-like protein n=1 Tax=Trichoderma citrinoviride TaxID=58853 RepID=A0A2T4AZK8_9HYPO|nr:kinesin-like protein [Trichoderma citrinoviride]PTB62411.1 kinesin-like protein [Trichoderma citrinoviride]